MKSFALAAALALSACGSLEPLTLPPPSSVKDGAPAAKLTRKPEAAPAKVVLRRAYTGIANVVVVAENERLGTKLEQAMFHELNRLGHVAPNGNWKIIGAMENDKVFWRIVDERGMNVIDFQQSGVTEASVLAVVPALAFNLPKSP